MKKSVVIIQRVLPQYRIAFFNQLKRYLAVRDVRLRLIYGQGDDGEQLKKDQVGLEWAEQVKNRYMFGKLVYQPCVRYLNNANLIIIEQANRMLLNYYLLSMRKIKNFSVAFWGHGFNRQGNPKSLSERFKRKYVIAADWWFAYTRGTMEYLENAGVPSNRICVADNAIDTKMFTHILSSVKDHEVVQIRKRFGITEKDVVALYCGALYLEKRVPYLLEAARNIHALEPKFRLFVIGGGIEQKIVSEACEKYDFIEYLGPLFRREKAIWFKLAQICLNPGLVGLGVLDSFAAGLPVVSTKDALHSPEIEYLKDGVNGILICGNEEEYARRTIELIRDRQRQAFFKSNALETASCFNVENMVENVGRGILECLASMA